MPCRSAPPVAAQSVPGLGSLTWERARRLSGPERNTEGRARRRPREGFQVRGPPPPAEASRPKLVTVGRAPRPRWGPARGVYAHDGFRLPAGAPRAQASAALRIAWETARSKTPAEAERRVVGPAASVDTSREGSGGRPSR